MHALASTTALALAAAITVAPTRAWAQEPSPPPDPTRPAAGTLPPESLPILPLARYHERKDTRSRLVVAGSLIFGLSYIAVATTALNENAGGVRPALVAIPIAGPLTVFGPGGCGCLHSTLGAAYIVGALAQTAGAAMLVAGVAAPTAVLVRDKVAEVRMVPTPLTFGKSSAGLGLSGTF